MRVLVVDRKPLFRDALAALVRSLITGLDVVTVPTLAEAAPLMGRLPLGLLILEAEQAGLGQVVAAIRLVHPGWRIALLGGPPRGAALPHIDGHLGTEADSATVIAELRRLVEARPARPAYAAEQGGGALSATTGMAAAEWVHRRAAAPSIPARALTRRQQDVLSLLAQGRSTKEIARTLDLGIGTIKAHLDAIYRTLGVHGRLAAVARAQALARPDPPVLSLPAAEGDNVIRLGIRAGYRTARDPVTAPPTRPSTVAR